MVNRSDAPALVLVAVLSVAAVTPLFASPADQDAQFQTVLLNSFVCDDFYWGEGGSAPQIPLAVPKKYEKTPAPFAAACVWSTKSDVERIFQPDTASPAESFFKIQASRNTGFDAQRNVFVSGPDQDETNMADALRTGGVRDVTVKRYTIQGAPILIVEGVLSSGQPSRLVYLATQVGTNAIMINYVPRKPWSEWDSEVWARFKHSLVGE